LKEAEVGIVTSKHNGVTHFPFFFSLSRAIPTTVRKDNTGISDVPKAITIRSNSGSHMEAITIRSDNTSHFSKAITIAGDTFSTE
jgi:hypothetical protein